MTWSAKGAGSRRASRWTVSLLDLLVITSTTSVVHTIVCTVFLPFTMCGLIMWFHNSQRVSVWKLDVPPLCRCNVRGHPGTPRVVAWQFRTVETMFLAGATSPGRCVAGSTEYNSSVLSHLLLIPFHNAVCMQYFAGISLVEHSLRKIPISYWTTHRA